MKAETIKEKLGGFFKKLGKKNLIVIAAFAVVAVALVVGVTVFSRSEEGFDYSQGAGMQDVGSESDKNKETENSVDTYFSSVELDRKRTRDEALEVLQSVVDDDGSTEEARSKALAEITAMAKAMEAEANIETLIEAKGFSECVAVIKDDSASIVVRSDGLQTAQISQINEIVYEQSGILPVNIKIIQR
jgi:stage III sporulation protein AH